jgi:hypothetical protein
MRIDSGYNRHGRKLHIVGDDKELGAAVRTLVETLGPPGIFGLNALVDAVKRAADAIEDLKEPLERIAAACPEIVEDKEC